MATHQSHTGMVAHPEAARYPFYILLLVVVAAISDPISSSVNPLACSFLRGVVSGCMVYGLYTCMMYRAVWLYGVQPQYSGGGTRRVACSAVFWGLIQLNHK